MDMDVGDYINLALVLITLWVAWQAKRSADAAAAELALARRPLVLISRWDVKTHVDQVGPHLVADVTFEDGAGVPTTLHSTQIAIHFGNYMGVPEVLTSGRLLYRSLKYVAEKAVDFDDDLAGTDAHVADVHVKYLFSAAGDHRCQEWFCQASVYRIGDGFLCHPSHPHLTRDDWDRESKARQSVRQILTWWKQTKAEMGTLDC